MAADITSGANELAGLDLESRQMVLDTIGQLRKRLLTKDKILEYDKDEIFPEDTIRDMLGPEIGLQLRAAVLLDVGDAGQPEHLARFLRGQPHAHPVQGVRVPVRDVERAAQLGGHEVDELGLLALEVGLVGAPFGGVEVDPGCAGRGRARRSQPGDAARVGGHRRIVEGDDPVALALALDPVGDDDLHVVARADGELVLGHGLVPLGATDSGGGDDRCERRNDSEC